MRIPADYASAAAGMAVMTRGDGGFDEAGAFAAAAAFQRLGGDAGAIETRHFSAQILQQCSYIRGQLR